MPGLGLKDQGSHGLEGLVRAVRAHIGFNAVALNYRGFRAWGLGWFGVEGLGFGVSGLGFRF